MPFCVILPFFTNLLVNNFVKDLVSGVECFQNVSSLPDSLPDDIHVLSGKPTFWNGQFGRFGPINLVVERK